MQYRVFFFCWMLLGTTGRLPAQTHKIDSLTSVLSAATDDNVRLKTLLLLCEEGKAMHTDRFGNYVMKAKALAVKLHDERSLLQVEYELTSLLAKKGSLDTALQITDHILTKYPREYINKDTWLKFAMQKARLYDRSNQYRQAITQLYDVLNAAEQWNDTAMQVQVKTGIGWIQLETEQYKEALSWFYRALAIPASSGFMKEYSALYSNIASAYNKLGRNDSAELYINKAIRFGRETESLTFLATSLNIAADIYIDTHQPAKAEAALHEAIRIRKQINDPYYTMYDISRLANWYAHTGSPEKGIELCKTGIDMARQSGLTSQLQLMYYALAQNYKVAGNTTLYGETLEKIIALKDSFSAINSSNLLTELRAKYEEQRQQNTIIQQKLNLSRKNTYIYGALALLLLAGVATFFIFRDYRRKQWIKVLRMQEEEKRLAEKAVQDAEEKERKRIAADLHDNLGAYVNAVLHGTELLQQENTNGHSKELVKNLNSASKDVIVSLRETIWALKKESYTAEECLLRIRNFVQSLNRHYESRLFEVTGTSPENFTVHYSRALHLVRMLQEAITNAIKHAEATHITIISEVENGDWKLQVKDNGKGFSPQDVAGNKEHNGLVNLSERAKAANIGLSIHSEAGRGTLVSLLVKPSATIIQK